MLWEYLYIAATLNLEKSTVLNSAGQQDRYKIEGVEDFIP